MDERGKDTNNMALVSRGKLDATLASMFSNPEFSNTYLFYAHMVSQCSIKIVHDLPAPAGVSYANDHYNLYINPSKFDMYTPLGRLAILKHEMLHILYGHLEYRAVTMGYEWNLATDCALNQQIDIDHLPPDAITPINLGQMLKITLPFNESAEFYYNTIKDTNNGTPKPSMGTHDTWEDSTGDADLQNDITKSMISRSMDETIQQHGTVPFECSTWLELVTRKSVVDWRRVLRGVVGNKTAGTRRTIRRSDRRFPLREDLKGKTKDHTFNLLVIADVSGSMLDKDILSTLSEVQHICKNTKTDANLIQIDTVAYEPEKLTSTTTRINRKGSGGTLLYPAIVKAKECRLAFDAIVVLTDGGVGADDILAFEKLKKKVVWLICPNGYFNKGMNVGKMKIYQLY